MLRFSDIEQEGDITSSSSFDRTRPPQGGMQPSMAQSTSEPNKNLQRTQAQVNEVVDIMRNNMEKVLERDEKLSELDDRADALQAGAHQFQTTASRIKRKYWWQNIKMILILVAVILVIVIIIVVSIVTSVKKN